MTAQEISCIKEVLNEASPDMTTDQFFEEVQLSLAAMKSHARCRRGEYKTHDEVMNHVNEKLARWS